MDIVQLRYFLIASKSRSFSATAKTAFTSRQNLTRAIHQLENELGANLFVRSGNDIKLTYAGEQAARRTEAILAEVDELAHLFAEDAEAATIELALAENTTALFPALNADCFGDIPLALSEHGATACCSLVASGKADVALVACMKRDFPDCTSTLIAEDPFTFLCSERSDLAAKETVSIRDLKGHDVVLLPSSSFIYGRFLEAHEKLELPHSRVREIASIPLMKNEVKVHDAVAIVGKTFRSNPPAGLVCRPCSNPHMQWCLYALLANRSRVGENVRTLIDRAKQAVGDET
jgi:DNA-binding transcriptional LysR family regulator